MTLENVQIYACCPVDRSKLPQGPELDAIVITDLYEQDDCRMCRQRIWVGPRQWASYQLDTQQGVLLCYVCSFVVANRSGGLEVNELGGGHEREGVPL